MFSRQSHKTYDVMICGSLEVNLCGRVYIQIKRQISVKIGIINQEHENKRKSSVIGILQLQLPTVPEESPAEYRVKQWGKVLGLISQAIDFIADCSLRVISDRNLLMKAIKRRKKTRMLLIRMLTSTRLLLDLH